MRRSTLLAGLTGSVLTAALLVAPAAGADPAAPPPDDGNSVLVVHVDDSSVIDSSTLENGLDDAGATVRHSFPGQDSVSVAVPASSEDDAVTELNKLPGVTSVERPVVRTFTGVPNDPKFSLQSRYLNAVIAPTAWTTQHGSASVRIAVVDSGIDVGHPDFAGKIVGTYNARTRGTSIPDTVGHGTFVAGVAAADTGNGVGIAGAGYDTRLLGVKVDDADGEIAIDDEVAGIRWAADHGANIINLSLAGPDASSSEKAAIAYAQGKGVLVVAAAGNEGDSTKQYPAAYPGVVSVGATDPAHGSRASFSTYGSWVTLAAPGVGIYSTTPRAGSQFFPGRSGYAGGDGTSFASPIVAGEAALLKAQNPALSQSGLRAALVASSHGYQGRGLGAGQVDFALALGHTPPTSHPSALSVTGTSNRVTLTAHSSAPRVAFRVDGDARLPSVAVRSGVASSSFASWGFANGNHTLRAVDCTAYGECSGSAVSASFPLANAAPSVSSPHAGSLATGHFQVTGSATGGELRLLVDGHAYAAARAAPYTFNVDGTKLSDSNHRFQVQSCSLGGAHCSGPFSAQVTIAVHSLHPRVTSLSPSAISPNRDKIKDSGTLTFTLPDTESVTISTIDAHGVVRARSSLGTLGAGRHTWIWRGTSSSGARLPDGTYSLTLDTSRATSAGTLRGYATRTAVVDTSAPRTSGSVANRSTFYPAKDGYKDTFTAHTVLHGGGTLTMTISRSGKTVRTLHASKASGAATLSWNGRTASGKQVKAGKYSWRLTIADAAGNSSRSKTHHVTVSAKRLKHRTAYLTVSGAGSNDAEGSAHCAAASRGGSSFTGGLRLSNGCSTSSGDVAYAAYTFHLPKAHAYSSLSLQVYGHSHRHPSELTAIVQRTDGGLELPDYLKINSSHNDWHSISSVHATGHVTRKHAVHAAVLLTGRYSGRNDFDLRSARLRVRYTVLA